MREPEYLDCDGWHGACSVCGALVSEQGRVAHALAHQQLDDLRKALAATLSATSATELAAALAAARDTLVDEPDAIVSPAYPARGPGRDRGDVGARDERSAGRGAGHAGQTRGKRAGSGGVSAAHGQSAADEVVQGGGRVSPRQQIAQVSDLAQLLSEAAAHLREDRQCTIDSETTVRLSATEADRLDALDADMREHVDHLERMADACARVAGALTRDDLRRALATDQRFER